MKPVIFLIIRELVGIGLLCAGAWAITEYGHVNWWVAVPIGLMYYVQSYSSRVKDDEIGRLKRQLGDLGELKAHDGTHYNSVSHNFLSLNSMMGRLFDRVERLEERR